MANVDPSLPPPPPPALPGWLDILGSSVAKYAAVITALISIAVPVTEYVRGFTNQKIKETEERSKLALKEAEEKTKLAITYLDKIAAKDTGSSDRILYLGALTKLDGHPLKAWAEEQLEQQKKELEARKKASAALQEAFERAAAASDEIVTIQSQIEIVNLKIRQAQTSQEVDEQEKALAVLVEKKNTVRTKIAAQVKQISTATAQISAATPALTDHTTASAEQIQARLQDITKVVTAANTVVSALTTDDVLDKLTPATVKACWPTASAEAVEQNLPIVKAALKEFGLSDRNMVIAAMAVMRINSTNFAPFIEPESIARRYEGRADMGNTEPGDGVKFKGRGFIGLTGKANYALYGKQLGIDLLQDPDAANKPDIAARLMAAFLKRTAVAMRSAISEKDYNRALRLITGGTNAGDLKLFIQMGDCYGPKL